MQTKKQQIQNLTKQEVIDLTLKYDTLTDVMRQFNVRFPQRTTSLRLAFLEMVSKYNIEWKRDTRDSRRSFSKEELQQAVSESYNWTEVLTRVGLKSHGNNSRTIKRLVEIYGISIAHFDITKSHAYKNRKTNKKYTIDNLNNVTHRSILRRIVLQNNLIPYVCDGCNNTGTWNNKTLILQLDHIDGNSTNNNIDNLRFMCPNCHSQTETFGRKNKNLIPNL